MSTQSTLTVTGFVGSSVRFSVGGPSGVPYASFRLGCTERIRDRATQAWKDAPTQWYTVKVWRHVAANVVQSLRKGQPVVVTGRLRVEEWTSAEGPRTSLVLEATSLGHDLVFGTSAFERTLSPGTGQHASPGAGADETGPVDVTGLPLAGGDEADDDGGSGELGCLGDELHDDLDDDLDDEPAGPEDDLPGFGRLGLSAADGLGGRGEADDEEPDEALVG